MFYKLLKSKLDKITLLYFFIFIPLILGIIPREFSFLVVVGFIYLIIKEKPEFNLLLFIRLIPFFIAIPLTQSFDNFNIWRIYIILISFAWIIKEKLIFKILKSLNKKIKILELFKNYSLETGFLLFLLISLFSLFKALYIIDGIKRIIYLANVSLIFPVVLYYISKSKGKFLNEISNSIKITVIFLLGFAIFQQFLAYIIPINVFQHFWGETISLNMYGKRWSNIVMNLGNTWYSYPPGASPRLRVFSVFPDSHTFPMYLIMSLPFVIFLNFRKIKEFKFLFFLGLIFLFINLSGTRGIWLAGGISLIICFTFYYFVKQFRYLEIYNIFKRMVIMFFLSFIFIFIIYSIPQFLQFSEGIKKEALTKRIESVISFEEESNRGRLMIWKETIKSIAKNPFLGVGISNFPVVLKQPISYAKAGSTAHNLYLNQTAETGIIGGIIFLILLLEILRRSFNIFLKEKVINKKVFYFTTIFSLIWIYLYSFTDAALLDERTLLLFSLIAGVISGVISYERKFKKI